MATVDATTADRTQVRSAVRVNRRWLEIALFLAPAIALYVIFLIVPVVEAIRYSLYAWNGLGKLTDFVGLGNFREAFSDPSFRQAMTHNAILVALSLIIQMPLALAAALLLNRPLHGRTFFRLVFFAPYVLSEAITAVIFLQILWPGGLVDTALKSVGLGAIDKLWLADLSIVFYTMFVVITWKYIGFAIILFLAGLQGVPDELYEAAAMDGASSWRMLWNVTLPQLGPTIRIQAFLATIGSIQLFDIVWIMTLGGPAGSSSTMATYMVDQGFNSYRVGFAISVAMILFVICFAFSVLYQIFVLRRDSLTGNARMVG